MLDPMFFKGKNALITGAARRIGKAIALALAQLGINIVIHYNKSEKEARLLATELKKTGVNSWLMQADLCHMAESQSLIERALEVSGSLQILINNASIFLSSKLNNFTIDQLEQNLRINAYTPLLLSRIFAQNTDRGNIINFLDTKVTVYDKQHAAYHLSKRMLFTLTRMMALEYAPQIRVNAVAPGLILTPQGEDESYMKKAALANPLLKHGSLPDIIEAVLFLLKSDFITGQVLFIDGGYHMKGSMYGF
jgi:pteridine reductase